MTPETISEAIAWREERGWEMFAKDGHRLAQLTSVRLPDGVSDDLRGRLLHDHGIEIGGGLGELAGKVWRVGLMGHNSSRENVDRLLAALAQVL